MTRCGRDHLYTGTFGIFTALATFTHIYKFLLILKHFLCLLLMMCFCVEFKHRGLFLEMFPNGTITGTPRQTGHTVIELKAVKSGETAIWGVMSSRYLCIDASGQLVYLDADCSFIEQLESDGYTHFLSTYHKLPVSLNFKAEEQDNAEHFQTEEDLDSDDPLRLRQSVQNHRSPLFHMDQ
uniref:FGF n=1 Tax=Electrophorus electricus TaxID=8005 RepID=A0AAY5F315_ELEEL